MRTLQASVANVILSVAIANSVAFAIAVFASIANPAGSQTVLSTWAIVFGLTLGVVMGYLAVTKDR